MFKKFQRSIFLIGSLILLFLMGCQIGKTHEAPEFDTTKQQITIACKSLEELNLPVKLVKYEFVETLNTEAQIDAICKKLIDEENIVPEYNGMDKSSWQTKSIKERMSAYGKSPQTELNVVKNIETNVYPLIKTGDHVMKIFWEEDGNLYDSICIYNTLGIVYDNILSNITVIKENAPVEESITLPVAAPLSKNAEQSRARYSFTSTVRDIDLNWIWGSTRGNIYISHYVIWNGSNTIYTHGGSANAWMTLGTAKASKKMIKLNSSSYSKMAWGYGYTTPTGSVSISFDYSNLEFSVSVSGLGSSGKAEGIHTIYI